MKALLTLLRALLLAAVPFLLATLKTATFGPCFAVSMTTPCLSELLDPVNMAVSAFFGYESVIRVIPTEKDRSAVNFLARLVDAVLRNNGTGYTSGKLAAHAPPL